METEKCEIPSVDIRQLSKEVLELFSGIKQLLVIKGVGSNWNLSKKLFTKIFWILEVLVSLYMCLHVCAYICCVYTYVLYH